MDVSNWEYLRHLDILNTAGATPKILMEENYAQLKFALNVIVAKPNAPVATHTPLRWAVHGPFISAGTNTECLLLIHHTELKEEISRLLKQF